MSMAHSKHERYQTLWLWAAKDCLTDMRMFSPLTELYVDEEITDCYNDLSTWDYIGGDCRVCGSKTESVGYRIDKDRGSDRIVLKAKCSGERCYEVMDYYGIPRDINSNPYRGILFDSRSTGAGVKPFKNRVSSLVRFTGMKKVDIEHVEHGALFDAMLIVMIKRGDV